MKSTLIALMAAALLCGPVLAQEYPSKPVRILVPFAAGGTVDIAARHIGQALSKKWDQPVVVENRPGGNGFIATSAAARAQPDGYTLLMAHTGEFSVNPAIFSKVPYDLDRDFVAISLVSDTPLTLAVPADSPIKTVADIVERSRAEPGSITFSTPGTGSYNHLAGEWFASTAGIKLMHVPYRGGAPASAAVASGEVALGVLGVSAVNEYVKGGRIRVVAVMTPERLESQPEWPTVEESGVAGIDASNWVGLFAPKGTPADIVKQLNEDVVAAVKTPELKAAFSAGGGSAVGTTSEAFTARIKRELKLNKDIAANAGVRVEQ
ncbi:MAG TPA: tripartite tricarboxylate transporter substrate binding protein [Burkholderiaceae bacterium]|nr:tripartite tricarboxylate transporter substrate binding protein [Burkholderiaceae bacterium]